ncbi:MAG: acyl-CoA dehydrogenase family protein [Chloroflexota bacterium]|nr:acyl-CoA dehydrogenase family protein [Chloroflexota bacterium]
MISFTPTDEQQQLIDTIRRYSKTDVQPIAHDADENERIPADVIASGWQIGLTASAIPEELGGLGEMSALTGVLALEAFGYGDLATALHVLTPALFALPLVLYGTAEQRAARAPQFLDETPPRVTAALLEPGVFFDAHDLKTTAAHDGDTVTLNGTKAVVPLAASAETLLVYARESVSGRIDAYIVDAQTPGVEIGAREKLMGVRALPTYRVNFNGARVDAACKLGGAVGINYDALLSRGRLALAALAVGMASAAFEYARDYAKQRVQFGVPIAQKQAVAFMLAEMAIEVDAARLMAWDAAWRIDNGEDGAREAYLAKEYADKAVMQVTDSAVQVLGGYGFIREYPVERYLRNARGIAALEGLAVL